MAPYPIMISLLALCVLLIAMDHALAASRVSGCNSQPLSARQAAHFTPCRVLIVGAGPGGLYSAYFLRELGRDLCLVEKKTELGDELLGVAAAAPLQLKQRSAAETVQPQL